MDDQADEPIEPTQPTQPSTQPYADPRRVGCNNSGLTSQDVSDVICILYPGSISAHSAVAATALSAPEHVLQNDDLGEVTQGLEFYDDDHPQSQMPQQTRTWARDIALRMSSRVKDPTMGFCFGRNAARCDIVIVSDPEEKRISNVHFRIYLNKEGILMLQDTSTNGTIVDDCRLRGKGPHGGESTRMLNAGSIIQVVTNIPDQEIKFIVRIPSRDGFREEYKRKLAQYVANLPWCGPSRDLVFASTAGENLYGMHWNGGSTYNVAGQIGKGAFATVYKLATKRDGMVFAAKELDKRRFMKNGILDMKIDNEMRIMKGLRHPNIVQYEDYHDHDQWIYIIMEFVPGGELSGFMTQQGRIPEVMVKSITRQILHALEYLHKRKITHRDIKPDNILIASFDPLMVKLSDFGLSKVVREETFLKTFCGTLLYCAPEVYPEYERYRRGDRKRRRLGDPIPKTSPYNSSVDMWSFGAVLYQVLAAKPPYAGRGDDRGAQMLRNIMTTEADFEVFRERGVSEEGIDFIAKLLNREPARRPRERECFQHPWIFDVPDVVDYMDVDDIKPNPINTDLGAIDEAEDEDDLGASQLDIQGSSDENDSGEEDALEVDELAARYYQSKRQRVDDGAGLARQEIPSTPEVFYSHLPETDSIQNGSIDITPRADRLFGEITASALRSSGVLGQNTRVALEMPAIGNHDEQISVNDFVTQAQSESSNDTFAQQPLQYPHALPIPAHLGGSAPSLMGAEALVGQLNMASPETVNSPKPTPNSNNPTTPKTRETSPPHGRNDDTRAADITRDTDIDSTPKRRQFDRHIEIDGAPPLYHDHETTPRNPKNASKIDGQGHVAEQATGGGKEVPSEEIEHANLAELARTIDEWTGEEVHDEDGDTLTEIISETSKTDADNPGVSQPPNPSIPTFPTASASINAPEFVKPLPRLGKLSSVPGSFADITIRLDSRMTSWGRGPCATVRYPDPLDRRIPAYALELTFWAPGIEKKIADGQDWMTVPNVMTIISTKTRSCVWINDVELRSESAEKDGFLFGKLYTGDVITIHKSKDKFLKFRCEFYHGDSAQERPEGKQGFLIEKEVRHYEKVKKERQSMLFAENGTGQ